MTGQDSLISQETSNYTQSAGEIAPILQEEIMWWWCDDVDDVDDDDGDDATGQRPNRWQNWQIATAI